MTAGKVRKRLNDGRQSRSIFRRVLPLLCALAALAGAGLSPGTGVPAFPGAEGFGAFAGGGQGANRPGLDAAWRVQSSHPFRTALKKEIGFSFTFDGKEVGPDWPEGRETDGEAGGTETRFRHRSGLTVIRQARAFVDFEAVEYTVRFKNESRSPLPILADVNALDLTFGDNLAKRVSVVWSGGGGADRTFPPKDFRLTRTSLGTEGPSKDHITLAARNGLPSSVNLPLFFIEDEKKAAGIFVGIGWAGDWKATVRTDSRDNALRIQGGMPGIRIQLEPGEEISGPRILVGCFRGPLENGFNRLRRVIGSGYMPSIGGERLVAPVLYTTWFDIGAELDEKLCRTLVNRAAELGQEIFEVDAGWYAGTPSAPYTDMRTTWKAISGSLGNWELGEERTRFPSGLRSLADLVRSKGMRFGLWFEPERVGPESLLARKHPDWVTFITNRGWGYVDFSNPEVQQYYCNIFDRYIKDLGLQYIRWDNNIEVPLSYWEKRDPPNRRGISQIRHLEGVHRVEDWIRKNHPDVILESCAGGGQSINLATLQRRHTIWISDMTMNPQIVQFHLEGLNCFIPGNRQIVAFAPMRNTYRRTDHTFPDIVYQSCFGGAFGLAGRLHEWPETMMRQARKHFDVFKKIRNYLAEDFYPLAPQARSGESWSAWQFHDPRTNEGFVQAFRIRSQEQTRRFLPRALDEKSEYSFTDPYTGRTFQSTGAKLLSDGIEFDLPQMASRVWMYRKSD